MRANLKKKKKIKVNYLENKKSRHKSFLQEVTDDTLKMSSVS